MLPVEVAVGGVVRPGTQEEQLGGAAAAAEQVRGGQAEQQSAVEVRSEVD